MDPATQKEDYDHVEKSEGEDSPVFVPDPAAERRLVRKLDFAVLPWIMLLYLVSYMDRGNIGNVRQIGLTKDLQLSSFQFQVASFTFYIGAAVFSTFGGLMLKVVQPSTWLALCAVTWGAMAALQAVVTNAAGLAAVRFFLGACEASFAPGCALYLSFWYLRSELSLRIAAYTGTSALSGIVSGLIAYGFGQTKGLTLPAWKAVFIVEGIPTVALGILTYFLLPGRPESMTKTPWFLAEGDLQILHSRRTRFVRNKDDGIDLQQVKKCLLDFRLYLFIFIYSGLSLSLAVASVFLPTLVATIGYTSVRANLMTVPVYATAYVSLLVMAWCADRLNFRGPFIAFGGIVSGIGYLLLGVLRDDHARYGSAFLAISGTYMAFPIVLSWISSTFAGDTKAGLGIGIVIAVTHAVGIAASNIYPESDAPYYLTGNIVSCALAFTTAVGALVMGVLLYRENRRRDRQYGRPEANVPIDMGDSVDMVPDYRYIL